MSVGPAVGQGLSDRRMYGTMRELSAVGRLDSRFPVMLAVVHDVILTA